MGIVEFCNKYKFDFFRGCILGLCSQFYAQYLAPNMSPSIFRLFWIAIVTLIACWFWIKITLGAKSFKQQQANRGFFMIFIMIDSVLILRYVLADYIIVSWL